MRGFAIPLVLLAACSKSSAPPPAPPPTVTVAELKPADVVDATEYLATLRSRTAAVIQPQVEGQITKILVTPGATVAPGQPLIEIDPGRQPAAVAQARVSRASREASLQLAEQNLTRTQQLVGTTVFGGMILSSVLNLAVIPVPCVVIEKAREHRGTPGSLGETEHANDHGARQP